MTDADQQLALAAGLVVYERLLDAFCGKLVAGGQGRRDFVTSDIAQFAELFIPEAHRESVFAFVRGNVCSENDIGQRVATCWTSWLNYPS